MTLDALLSTLEEKGVELWLDENRLRYRAPAGGLNDDLMAELKHHKSAIMERLAPKRIKCLVGSGPVPVSFGQQRLWYLDRLVPDSPLYNEAATYRLKGYLHEDALIRSLREIVGRHDSLRTIFTLAEPLPLQVVRQQQEIEVSIENLDEEGLGRRITEEASIPFDLSRGPLVRCFLFRLAPEDHVLLFVTHHIVYDGWSGGVLQQELAALYESYANSREPTLPVLPIQYSDYSVWQRQHFESDSMTGQLSYWCDHLAGRSLVLELSTDRMRPAVFTYRGARRPFVLSAELTTSLRRLAKQERATLFMVLLAAFKTLLYRYSGQEEICVGSPVAGRSQVETEGMIGCFINTLILVTDFDESLSFRDLLAKIRQTCFEAYGNQDIPFERIVEELQPDRDTSRTPLFQVLFAFQDVSLRPTKMADLLVESSITLDTGTAKTDVTLQIEDTGKHLQGRIEYNTDLFDAETIDRRIEHYRVLLESIVEDADCLVARLPMLTKMERHKLLVEWNNTRRDYPLDKCLHEAFEEQVERTPDAVALVFQDESLTYRELNERANRWARQLRELGVASDVMVGICAERSFGMMVGIYAVLKAGGAYVPLDPDYPQERLAWILEDAHVDVLLTQKHLQGRLPAHDARIVCLDDGPPPGMDASNLPLVTQVDNLAYTIFTSGSTGRPKGVMVPHKAIVNRLLWMQEQYGLTDADVVLQKTPTSFDVSVWELFWPLLIGAKLVLAKPEGHRDSSYLVRLINEQQVTTLHFVPSMLQFFLNEEQVESCTGIRRVICSGEALPMELQDRFFQLLDSELHNLYGPTEAAVDVTYWACHPEPNVSTVPIGRPVANTQIYLLDSNFNPVPIGARGELYIGGVQVARGYINRDDLTSERFLEDPFSKIAGARLYRTGDICRYRSDGAIEYLGRSDHQVKIRGFRIELDEIVAVLSKHPWVRESVIVDDDDRLVAYIVPNSPTETPIDELREFLRNKLPTYMVPAAFMVLESIPLTHSGKIDRKSLPKQESVRQTSVDFVVPEEGVEEMIADIWKDVLQVKEVGAQDNFFDLGGHSLLLITLNNRINKQLGCQLSMVDMFQYPTVRQLAQALNSPKTKTATDSAMQDRVRNRVGMMKKRRDASKARRRI